VLVAALGVSASSLSACRRQRETDHGALLARVGTRVIGEVDFQRYLADSLPPDELAATHRDSRKRRLALDDFLDQTAVSEKARRAGIPREGRFLKAVELMEMKLLAHLTSERNREAVLRSSQVPAAEVRSHYEAHKHELLVEPRFTFRQVLVYVRGNPAFPDRGLTAAAARAKAAKALSALRGGAAWAEVVKVYSDEAGTDGKGQIRDGRFGYFAKEVEAAIRTQPLGRPGEPFRSIFGYHVIEVVERSLESQPKPFDQVKEMLAERLRDERAAQAGSIFMAPIASEMGLSIAEAGAKDASSLNPAAVPADTILALVGKRPVRESDFQWFLKDALLPEQRIPAYSRPGARQGMLRSFLDMLVLEAKARKDGLHRSSEFLQQRASMEERLLAEFMQDRDKTGPRCDCGSTEEERRATLRRYFDRTRVEVGLVVVAGKDGGR
jgi:hypothetical protein